jgi:hypothetical protein
MEERKEEVDVVADLVWKDVCEELVRRCEVQDRIRQARATKPDLNYWRMYDLRDRDAYRGALELPAFLTEIKARYRMNRGVYEQICGNCGRINQGLPTYIFCGGCTLQEYCSYPCREAHAVKHVGLCERASKVTRISERRVSRLQMDINLLAHAYNRRLAYVAAGRIEQEETDVNDRWNEIFED